MNEDQKLSWRDIFLLMCAAREMLNKTMADRIGRSEKLVEKDMHRICRALGATTRTGAVHNAWMRGVFKLR